MDAHTTTEDTAGVRPRQVAASGARPRRISSSICIVQLSLGISFLLLIL